MALADDLVAYWKLDESAGATRVDEVNGYDLTDHGTVGSSAGKLGAGCAIFDSAGRYLSRASNADLQLSGDLSGQAWCWVDVEGADAGTFLAKWGSGGNEYILQYDQSVHQFLVAATVGGSLSLLWATTFGTPSLSTWYHVTFGYDSGGNSLWIAVNAGTRDTASTSGSPVGGTAPLTLGAQQDESQRLVGRADEVAIWKRVLTTGEATTLYNGGAGLAYPFAAGPAESSASSLLCM